MREWSQDSLGRIESLKRPGGSPSGSGEEGGQSEREEPSRDLATRVQPGLRSDPKQPQKNSFHPQCVLRGWLWVRFFFWQ